MFMISGGNMANQGTKLEKRTHDYLTKQGYLVHTVKPPPAVYREVNGKKVWLATSNQDLFGMFDHIAINNNGIVIFVQTKSSKQYGKQLDIYKDFPSPYKYIYVWKKGENGRYNTEPIIQEL